MPVISNFSLLSQYDEQLFCLPIAVPPQLEIEEIVCHVEFLFAFTDRLEARDTIARTQVEKLTPSLLAKVFRGELVLQDPNDESASVLLGHESLHQDRTNPEKNLAVKDKR